MIEVYFIRHGETDYNLNHIVQGGGVDSSLNHTGRMQAVRFFSFYKHTPFDAVISSQLRRTYQTVQPFESIGHTIERYPEFNELNWGELEGRPGSPEIREAYKRMNEAWDTGDGSARVAGGESPEEGWKRAQPGISRLMDTYPAGSRVLVCAHGRILRIMLTQMLGYGYQNMNLFPHRNTALNLLQLRKNSAPIAIKMNDLSHLES